MIAAQVHGGRRYGQLYSNAAERARRTRPLDAEDRAGALAHPRREHPRSGPVSPLWAGDSRPARVGCGRAPAHLPLFDVPVCVEIRPKRYRCPSGSGSPTTTPRCAWYEPRSPNTQAYDQWAWRMLINSPVADAARKLGVSEETIAGLLDRWIARTVDWDARERRGVIGLDEIALTRGHRDVGVLVTVPLEGGGVELLAVLADRQKETVAACLRAMPEHLRRPSSARARRWMKAS